MEFVKDKINPRDFRTLSIPQSANIVGLWGSALWCPAGDGSLSGLEAEGGAAKSCCAAVARWEALREALDRTGIPEHNPLSTETSNTSKEALPRRGRLSCFVTNFRQWL